MTLDPNGPLDLKANQISEFCIPSRVVRNERATADSSTVEAGLLYKAMGVISANMGMGFERSTFDTALHQIDKLDTATIMPADDYVKESLTQPVVQKYLRNHFFRKSIFMVTSLKIARKGAQIAEASVAASERFVQAEGGGGVGESSAGAKTEGSKTSSEYQGISFMIEKDFIYAFQVRNCHFGSRRIKKDLYTKDALLSTSAGEDFHPSLNEEEEREDDFEFEFYGVGDDDVTVDDLGKERRNYETVSLVDEAREFKKQNHLFNFHHQASNEQFEKVLRAREIARRKY